MNNKNDGEVLECMIFLAIPEADTTPDKGYLNGIIDEAKIAGLPENYIERLEKWRS